MKVEINKLVNRTKALIKIMIQLKEISWKEDKMKMLKKKRKKMQMK
jgi:hypothetical protein